MQTDAVELLQCWRSRWAETSVVLMVGLVLMAFVVGAVALVQEYQDGLRRAPLTGVLCASRDAGHPAPVLLASLLQR